MGQAKQRSSLDDRIAKAKSQKLGGERITIDEAKYRLGLPDSAEFQGYVIHLYDEDEFVGRVEESDLIINRIYVKIPDLAYKYDSAEDAVNEALRIDKYRLMVCVLFEVDNKHIIHDIWANFEDEKEI